MTPPVNSLRILIVDDEPLARERARRLLSKINDLEIVGEASNGREALDKIEALQPDVVLLDIQMPELDGLRMIDALDDPPAIIFSTAFEHHAVRAFDLEAVDYLLKPYSAQRLGRAVDRARRLLSGPSGAGIATDSDSEESQPPTRIPALDGRTTVLVPPEQIILLRICEGVVFLIRSDGESLLCSPSLSELEAALPARMFFRASRKAILNLDAVESVAPNDQGGFTVKLKARQTETVSRRRARHLQSRLDIR